MHMADALLSPAVGGGFWAITLGTLTYAARKLKGHMDERLIPLMGVLGAFVFAGQMVNFTIPATGSSGHLGGGLLLAIMVGPHAAFIVIASVSMVQALFFADGGLLALGSNVLNLGFYPCYIAYPFIYKMIARENPSRKKVAVASVISAVAAFQLGAFSVVLQTRLSGISELPLDSFLLIMLPIHLVIGIIEGFITAGIVIYAQKLQPEILVINADQKASLSIKKAIIVFSMLAVVTGGVLSWFASVHPDGLEWSIMNISGKSELPEMGNAVARKAAEIREKTTILPDYGFPANNKDDKEQKTSQWPAVDPGKSVSGLVGGIIVLFTVMLTGFVLRAINKQRKKT